MNVGGSVMVTGYAVPVVMASVMAQERKKAFPMGVT